MIYVSILNLAGNIIFAPFIFLLIFNFINVPAFNTGILSICLKLITAVYFINSILYQIYIIKKRNGNILEV